MIALFHVQRTYPVAVVLIALIVSAASAVFTIRNLQFVTTQRSLIAQDNRFMQLLDKADKFSEMDSFVVAIENHDKDRTVDFADALTKRLRSDREHFGPIFDGVDPKAFRSWALLYLSRKDLSILCKKIEEYAPLLNDISGSPGVVSFFEQINKNLTSEMVNELFTGFLDEGPARNDPASEDIDFLLKTVRSLRQYLERPSPFVSPLASFFGDGSHELEDGRVWTDGRKYLLISVAPKTHSDGSTNSKEGLQELRRIIAEARSRYPGISVGVTGQKALDGDETEIARRSMRLATMLSLGGLAVLLIVFWRGLRRPLVEMSCIIVALAITFGLITLVVGHLNLLSVTFAPMLLGLGIDYGIHWFARYSEEERLKGASIETALETTMSKVGRAILLAGLSASLSFFPLILTGFKGLMELGLICAMGMCVMTITTLMLLPPLILLFDSPSKISRMGQEEGQVQPFIRLNVRTSFLIVSIGLAALAAGLWGTTHVRFDLNTLHLQSKNAESVIWEKKLIENSKMASIHGVLFAGSMEEIERKTVALEKLPTVSEVQSIKSLLPSEQKDKLRLLGRLKPIFPDGPTSLRRPPRPVNIPRLNDILGRIRFKMISAQTDSGIDAATMEEMREISRQVEEIRRLLKTTEPTLLSGRLKDFENSLIMDLDDKLDLLRAGINARPMTFQDLPKALFDRFAGPDNLYLIRVLPSENIWEPVNLSRFVADLHSVDPDATGDPVTLSVFTNAFKEACIKAAIYAVIFIFIFLALTLRSLFLTILALIPLLFGTVWTFGVMQLFGVNLNLANTVFLPLIVGAGVEYGIIVLSRSRQEHREKSGMVLPVSTAVGVILAGLTTTVGFGSLVISEHQGVRSLGMLTTIGSIAVLVAAVVFLPALLHLFQHHGEKNSQSLEGNAPEEVRIGKSKEKGEIVQ